MGPSCEHDGELLFRFPQVQRSFASMGPSCEHDGEGPARPPSSPLLTVPLQWGRRANTTESDSCPSITRVDAKASMGPSCEHDGEYRVGAGRWVVGGLQWGRRANTTESFEIPEGAASNQVASMGPSCEHDGELWEGLYQAPMGAPASMGPSCEHDGELTQVPWLSGVPALQWGRRANTTERAIFP